MTPAERLKALGGKQYSSNDVARLTGVPRRTIQYWVAAGFVTPSGEVGPRNRFTALDLVRFAVLAELSAARLSEQAMQQTLFFLNEPRTVDAVRASVPMEGGGFMLPPNAGLPSALGRYLAYRLAYVAVHFVSDRRESGRSMEHTVRLVTFFAHDSGSDFDPAAWAKATMPQAGELVLILDLAAIAVDVLTRG